MVLDGGAARTKRVGAALRWLAIALGLSCQAQPALELLEVNAVSPPEAPFGEDVRVIGDGFALSSPATVSLRGQVYRAGQPARSVDVTWRARTESQRELVLELPREEERLFCGELGGGSHATFRGDVAVAIAAKVPGAPPVTGTLHGAVLELYPALEAEANRERLLERGRRALAFFGIEISDVAAPGLVVQHVLPESRAFDAGIEPGDRIVRAGGLSVLSPSDLVPEPTRTLELHVVRGATEKRLQLDADGLTAAPPRELVPFAVGIGVLALGLLFWASPLFRYCAVLLDARIERSLARDARPLRRTSPRRSARGRLLAVLGGGLGSLVWLAVAGALLSPWLRRTDVDRSAGLLAVMFGASLLLAAWTVLHGGRVGDRWSLARGLRSVIEYAGCVAPGWLALAAACWQRGLDLDELARGQGPAPWAWNAFQNPGLGLTAVLLLLSTVPQPPAPQRRLASARPASPSLSPRPRNAFAWMYTCAVCAIVSLAFSGGDVGFERLGAAQAGDVRSASVAALVVLSKYAALSWLVVWLRSACFEPHFSAWSRISVRRGVPLAGVAMVLAHVWERGSAMQGLGAWVHAGAGLLFWLLCLAAAALALAYVRRAVHLPRRAAPFSPWL